MPNDLDLIKRHFENDRFAASSGMRLVELRPGFARTSLEIEERHLNSVGIVQGGAIFTLADLAFAMACNSAGKVAVAVSTNLSFLKATRIRHAVRRGDRGRPQPKDLHLHGAGHRRGGGVGRLVSGDRLHQGGSVPAGKLGSVQQ